MSRIVPTNLSHAYIREITGLSSGESHPLFNTSVNVYVKGRFVRGWNWAYLPDIWWDYVYFCWLGRYELLGKKFLYAELEKRLDLKKGRNGIGWWFYGLDFNRSMELGHELVKGPMRI